MFLILIKAMLVSGNYSLSIYLCSLLLLFVVRRRCEAQFCLVLLQTMNTVCGAKGVKKTSISMGKSRVCRLQSTLTCVW